MGNKAEYTPGPWIADARVGCVAIYPVSTSKEQSHCLDEANTWAIHFKQGKYLPENGWGLDSETVANAQLIASAPELLEALEALIKVYNFDSNTHLHGFWPECWEKAIDVVSKAKGE